MCQLNQAADQSRMIVCKCCVCLTDYVFDCVCILHAKRPTLNVIQLPIAQGRWLLLWKLTRTNRATTTTKIQQIISLGGKNDSIIASKFLMSILASTEKKMRNDTKRKNKVNSQFRSIAMNQSTSYAQVKWLTWWH